MCFPHPGDVVLGWGAADGDVDAEDWDWAGRAFAAPRRARMPSWKVSFMVYNAFL